MSDAVRDPDDASSPGADRLVSAAAQAAVASRARLHAAVADLALGADVRLSDYLRVTVGELLEGLVGTVELALRRRIAVGLPVGAVAARASLEAAHVALARPLLAAAGALHDAELIALLLRRADEHRLVGQLRVTHDQPEPAASPLDALARDDDPAIADAARRLAVVELRRIERFQAPVIAGIDLPAELQHRLVWRIAAALRRYLTEVQALDIDPVDAAIVPAVTALLASHDENDGVDACAMALVRALMRAGRLDDATIVHLASAGHLALLVAALASRAQIEPAAAWDMVTAVGGERLILLLRAADLSRAGSAELMLAIAPGETARMAAQLSGWDALSPDGARAALRLWRLDPGYREAILLLAGEARP